MIIGTIRVSNLEELTKSDFFQTQCRTNTNKSFYANHPNKHTQDTIDSGKPHYMDYSSRFSSLVVTPTRSRQPPIATPPPLIAPVIEPIHLLPPQNAYMFSQTVQTPVIPAATEIISRSEFLDDQYLESKLMEDARSINPRMVNWNLNQIVNECINFIVMRRDIRATEALLSEENKTRDNVKRIAKKIAVACFKEKPWENPAIPKIIVETKTMVGDNYHHQTRNKNKYSLSPDFNELDRDKQDELLSREWLTNTLKEDGIVVTLLKIGVEYAITHLQPPQQQQTSNSVNGVNLYIDMPYREAIKYWVEPSISKRGT